MQGDSTETNFNYLPDIFLPSANNLNSIKMPSRKAGRQESLFESPQTLDRQNIVNAIIKRQKYSRTYRRLSNSPTSTANFHSKGNTEKILKRLKKIVRPKLGSAQSLLNREQAYKTSFIHSQTNLGQFFNRKDINSKGRFQTLTKSVERYGWKLNLMEETKPMEIIKSNRNRTVCENLFKEEKKETKLIVPIDALFLAPNRYKSNMVISTEAVKIKNVKEQAVNMQLIQRIPFFRNYIPTKYFFFWKTTTR